MLFIVVSSEFMALGRSIHLSVSAQGLKHKPHIPSCSLGPTRARNGFTSLKTGGVHHSSFARTNMTTCVWLNFGSNDALRAQCTPTVLRQLPGWAVILQGGIGYACNKTCFSRAAHTCHPCHYPSGKGPVSTISRALRSPDQTD